MSKFDNLSILQKRFLNELGIYSDKDIPSSFYEVIESPNLSVSEIYCLSIGNEFSTKFYPSKGNKFHIKDLIGTNHERYCKKSWLDAFIDLNRCDENLEKFYNNPLYYDDENYDYGLKSDDSPVGLIVKNNKLYIFDRNGGGNNRLIIAKIRYLGLISQCKNEEERKRVEENSWYKADVRYCPNLELADTILDIEFVNSGYEETGYIVNLDKNSPISNPTYSILHSENREQYQHLTADEVRLFQNDMYSNVNKNHTK